jgi:ATP:ADP antiporter, AAA family
MTVTKKGVFAKAAKTLSQIESNELKATFVSAIFVFILMGSYYVLRPIRDSMASDWSDSEVSFLWNLNFVISAVLVAIIGFAVSRVRLRLVIPIVYSFFALSFVGFYIGIVQSDDRDFIDKFFYLWVSVFALFHVTMFWTLMADTFSKAQSKRLFAVIFAGGSAGTLVGPSIPTLFAGIAGLETLMLIASIALVSVVPLVFYLYRLKETELGNRDLQADKSTLIMGGKWWQGFGSFATSPYLLAIGAFILLYVFIGSFVYFEQKNLLEDFTRVERAQILGSIDWLVNLLTFGMALFLTGRMVQNLGMPSALSLMPFLVCAALLILAFAPILTVLLALQVFRRGGNYGLTRPAREMLYTQVSREDRFKAKPVVDIVVYRGGDAISSDVFAWLSEGIGLGLAAIAAVGAGLAALWGGAGVFLGKMFDTSSKRGSNNE